MDGIRTLLAALGTALSERWTLLYTRLGDILSAIGDLAPGEGGTLADVSTAVNELQASNEADNLVISGQLSQIQSLIANYVIPWEENIFYALRDMLNFMESGNGVTLPPLATTDPLDIGALGEHCARVQWMIDFYFDNWLKTVGDTVKVAGDAAIAIGLAALTVSSAGIGAIPLSLLTSGFIAARAARDEGVGGLQTEMTSPRRAALRDALYSASSAEAAQAVWYATIDTMTDVNEAYRLCWKAFIWSSWFNDLYNPTEHNNTTEPPLWNLTGYSEGACSLTGSIDFELASEETPTVIGGFNFHMLHWPSPPLTGVGYFSDPELSPHVDNDWYGAPEDTVITLLETGGGVINVYCPGAGFSTLNMGFPITIPAGISHLIISSHVEEGGTAFRVRIQVPD